MPGCSASQLHVYLLPRFVLHIPPTYISSLSRARPSAGSDSGWRDARVSHLPQFPVPFVAFCRFGARHRRRSGQSLYRLAIFIKCERQLLTYFEDGRAEHAFSARRFAGQFAGSVGAPARLR